MARWPDTAAVERVDASAYRVPTDFPETDGTLAWGETVMVVVEVRAGGRRGLGYEGLLLEGALTARGGALRPDTARPGLGLELKGGDATRYAAGEEAR